MRRCLWLLVLVLGFALAGCGYDPEVTRVRQPGGIQESPDPARYGAVRLVWVREFHKPRGLLAFPDGGRAKETAAYVVVYQRAGDGTEWEIGRIHLQPVRRADFGNLEDAEFAWRAPDRLHYVIVHGYRFGGGPTRTAEGELVVPPLP